MIVDQDRLLSIIIDYFLLLSRTTNC